MESHELLINVWGFEPHKMSSVCLSGMCSMFVDNAVMEVFLKRVRVSGHSNTLT